MNKPDTRMKRKYADTYRRTFDAPKLASAAAPPEPQAHSARCSVAIGSLPVSSAESLLEKWEWMAAHWQELADKKKRERCIDGGYLCQIRADGFALCAQQLRAEIAAATVRQPEGNAALCDGEKKGNEHE